MEPAPGQGCRCIEEYGSQEKHEEQQDEDDEDLCDNCGTELEWTLTMDGITRLECPNCGG